MLDVKIVSLQMLVYQTTTFRHNYVLQRTAPQLKFLTLCMQMAKVKRYLFILFTFQLSQKFAAFTASAPSFCFHNLITKNISGAR